MQYLHALVIQVIQQCILSDDVAMLHAVDISESQGRCRVLQCSPEVDELYQKLSRILAQRRQQSEHNEKHTFRWVHHNDVAEKE